MSTWREFEERYGETEAEHRCHVCGGWDHDCPDPGEDNEDEDED